MYSSAKKLQRVLTAGEIRKTFIDYFTVNHDHKFVRSSPVVPFCDPTVAFVNAGMNQFKSVFLNITEPPHKRVTNSQKCVRVGGKHNDLSVVGQDSYHHTFFEMLGNWSFGDYFKREACEMALELLRGPYNINPERLYVTYFGGDQTLGLAADLECYEIWRSLGFPSERILPFGSKDNFWEMGVTGPCGPCTEIHIDHRPDLGQSRDRAHLVNAGRPDVTELWNLVFIQYNRTEDGSIRQLPASHVDTGMGFERLTAILQNKSSNYDTDIFAPLFQTIQKISKAPPYSGNFPTYADDATLDTGYRILADHARMVTACLADGMLPDQNQKLRRVLRKALTTCEHVFSNDDLLLNLVPVVAETLGSAYPEMRHKQQDVMEVIKHEKEVFRALRESSSKAFAEIIAEFPDLEDMDLMECPGFVPAYRDLKAQKETFKNNILPGKFLYKLADTYGLTEDNFHKLADMENMKCDMQGYQEEVANARLKVKGVLGNNKHIGDLQKRIDEALARMTKQLPVTDNSLKYNYTYDASSRMYNIPNATAKVLGILHNDNQVSELKSIAVKPVDDIVCVITDVSNFYYESGGQQSDQGKLLLKSENRDSPHELEVINVKFMNDCVVHMCRILESKDNFDLKVGDFIELTVDKDHRKMNICHHTATHLLNGAIRSLFHKVTYQVSSAVTRDNCKLEVGIIGKRISREDVEAIEQLIGRAIRSASPVHVQIVNASDVLTEDDITIVPGEIYPETKLRLVKMNCDHVDLHSKELCCGTHVTNTAEIEYFSITNLKQTNRARFAFTAVAGDVAENVLKAAALIRHRVDGLEQQFKTDKLTNATELELQKIRNNILHSDLVLPYTFKMETLERINDILGKLKESVRTTLKEFVDVEMKNLMQEKPPATHPFILHYIRSSALMEEIPLQKATRFCNDRPILVIGMCDGIVKARSCVPKQFVSDEFDAEKWLRELSDVFKGQVAPPKGQNSREVCNMKGKRVTTQFEEQLEIAMEKANKFAKKHFG